MTPEERFQKVAAKEGYEQSPTAQRNRARAYGSLAGLGVGGLGAGGLAAYGIHKAEPLLARHLGAATIPLAALVGAGSALGGGYLGAKGGKAIANEIIGPPPSRLKEAQVLEQEKFAAVQLRAFRDELFKIAMPPALARQAGKMFTGAHKLRGAGLPKGVASKVPAKAPRPHQMSGKLAPPARAPRPTPRAAGPSSKAPPPPSLKKKKDLFAVPGGPSPFAAR